MGVEVESYRELVEDIPGRDSRGDARHDAGPRAIARAAPPAPGLGFRV